MRKEKILDVINFFISVSRDVIRFSNPGGLAVCFKGCMHMAVLCWLPDRRVDICRKRFELISYIGLPTLLLLLFAKY